ncbi:MAG: hypothetical protein K2P92_07490 [Bdellovibrionaceae bacterium]|nr:hypothetical protein [Pseudobdellovibrionaceae bacterium]
MNQALTHNEKMIAGAALAVVVAFFGVFSLVRQATPLSKNVEGSRINYKMARPESPYSEYTLEGRELDAQYEGLPEEKVKELKKEAAKAKVAETKKKEAAKKQAEVKKQEAARKAQVARAQKQGGKPLPAFSKTTPPVKPAPSNYSNNSGGTYFQQADANVAPVAEGADKNKKKFADYRNMIFATPTPEVMGQIVAAYRKGEISAVEYQAIAQDLLEQTDVKYQGLGLLALRSVPSLASLSQLVHAQPTLSPTYQAYVEEAYLAYFYPQNLGYFSSALGTKDKVLQKKVLSLLDVNLNKLVNGEESVFVDARNRRSTSNTNFTLSSFTSLLPSLQALFANAEDPELGVAAKAIAALINTTNNVAQN